MHSASNYNHSTKFQEITSKQLLHVYYRSDSYLTHILGLQKSEKLTDFLANKCITGFIVVLVVSWCTWIFLKGDTWSFEYHMYKTLALLIISCYFMMIILSMNRTAMRQCMSQFVFWFQIYKAVESSLWIYFIHYILLKDESIKVIELVADSFYSIGVTLFIVVFAATDAWHVSRNVKLFVTITGSFSIAYGAIYTTFLAPELVQDTSFSIIKGYTMDAQTLHAGSNQVLALFMLKQAILTLIKKDECVTIRYAPYVEWKDS